MKRTCSIAVVSLICCWLGSSCAGGSAPRESRIEVRDGLYGYVAADGTEIIPFRYASLAEIDSLLFVYGTHNRRYGLISGHGEVLTPAKYLDIGAFVGGRACAENEEGAYLLDRAGCEIAREDKIRRLSADRFSYRISGRGALYGLLDENGNRLTPLKFNDMRPFSEGLAGVEVLTPRNGVKWGFIDEQGNLAIPYRYDDVACFSEGLAAVGKDAGWGNNHWGYIDRSGKMVIPVKYGTARPFSEGLAVVANGGALGYIDRNGRLVIAYQFDMAGQFRDGYALVGKQNPSIYIPDKFGAVDRSGRLVVPMEYEDSVAVWCALASR